MYKLVGILGTTVYMRRGKCYKSKSQYVHSFKLNPMWNVMTKIKTFLSRETVGKLFWKAIVFL